MLQVRPQEAQGNFDGWKCNPLRAVCGGSCRQSDGDMRSFRLRKKCDSSCLANHIVLHGKNSDVCHWPQTRKKSCELCDSSNNNKLCKPCTLPPWHAESNLSLSPSVRRHLFTRKVQEMTFFRRNAFSIFEAQLKGLDIFCIIFQFCRHQKFSQKVIDQQSFTEQTVSLCGTFSRSPSFDPKSK